MGIAFGFREEETRLAGWQERQGWQAGWLARLTGTTKLAGRNDKAGWQERQGWLANRNDKAGKAGKLFAWHCACACSCALVPCCGAFSFVASEATLHHATTQQGGAWKQGGVEAKKNPALLPRRGWGWGGGGISFSPRGGWLRAPFRVPCRAPYRPPAFR